MYAYDPSLLRVQYAYCPTRLACMDLKAVKPNDSVYAKTIDTLPSEGSAPFEAILNSEAIGAFWNRPEMRVLEGKLHWVEEEGEGSWTPELDIPWRKDLLVYTGMKTVQQFLDDFFRLERRPTGIPCFGFRNFFRMKYTTPNLEDGCRRLRFQDFRCVSVTSVDLSSLGPNGIPEGHELVAKSQTYNLIAFVLETYDKDKKPAAQTYSLEGRPILPRNPHGWGLEKEMGTPNMTWFLFYARCRPDDQEKGGSCEDVTADGDNRRQPGPSNRKRRRYSGGTITEGNNDNQPDKNDQESTGYFEDAMAEPTVLVDTSTPHS
ncbi:hypothetical protein EKO27_g138 [Xylaria grammica]|uniref:Uncharacterized protein n=1 Tax=Xylaria grammica TaxID=363999 RepID=A0A439DKB5_9PEZI|nr:hypothetical protein EKO27_g138 [Xylaria grammica]